MPFKPGVSGNPNGRPLKGNALSDYAKVLLKRNKHKQTIVKAWITKCEAGDIDALRVLLERIEGKVKDTLAVEGISPIVIMSNIPDIEDDTPPDVST